MTLEILSPEKTLFRGEAERVTLPGASGEDVYKRQAGIRMLVHANEYISPPIEISPYSLKIFNRSVFEKFPFIWLRRIAPGLSLIHI